MSGTTDSQDLSEIYGYPVPDTWVSGQTITADWLNRNIRDSQVFLTYAPTTIVSRESTQSIPNNSETDITFDTEITDTDDMFSNPSTDITIQRPGIYAIQHSIDFAANTTGIRATHIAINGTIVSENGGVTAPGGADTGLTCSTVVALNKGDVVTCFCFQNSGGALNISSGTRLSLRLISTAALDLTFSTDGSSSSSTPTPPKSKPPTASAPTKHTKTYFATYSRTYDGDSTTTWDDSKHCYQGRYDSNRGNTRSLVGFNYGTIETDLAGATKMTGKFTFKVAHSYYNSGLTAVIGSHNYTSKPSTWASSHVYENQIRRSGCVAGRTYTVNLTSWQCWAFQQGVITGMAFGPGPSTSLTYYGYMYGFESGKPSLSFTYYK